MTQVGEFAGRFHPLLVHFPIALLILAGALELAAAWRRRTVPARAAAPTPTAVTAILALGALSASLAAGAGYLLGASGGYSGATYDQHRTIGLALAGLAVGTAAASWLRDRSSSRTPIRLARLLLLLTLIALTRAAHLGATLTHGEGYLTEHAPAPLKALIDLLLPGRDEVRRAGPADQTRVYAEIVAPILGQHCVSCHGAEKMQGGLRLDTPELIRKGGDKGPAIVPGRASNSELVRRVWLPAGHERAMPPKGRRRLSPADAAVLRWWVDSGASIDGMLADLEIPTDIVPALEALVGPIARGGPTLPPVALDAPDASALARIRARGVAIELIAAGSPFLQVRWSGRDDGADNERVVSLRAVARHVLWLDLAGTAITDAAFDTIAQLPHLTRLNVSRTATTDAGLAKLTPLAHLEYLNLYGTAVTDAGLVRLAPLSRLRRLYVWQTAVTPAGVQRLRAALPRVDAVLGATETATASLGAAAPSR